MSKFITNSFQVPNALVDELLADMSDAALRTYIIITRKTRGWNKECDRISLSQFKKIGRKSINTIRSGLAELVEMGLVIKHETVAGDVWELNDTVSKSDIANNGTVSKSDTALYQNLNLAVSKSDNTENNYTKTTNKKTNSVTPKQKAEPKEKQAIEKLIERGCDEQLAKDFIAHRKTKKSAITDTALNLISSQAKIAGIEFPKAVEICIARNWVSFNASWKWQDETPVAQYQVPTNVIAPEDTHVPVMTDYERDENGMPVFTPIDWSDVLAEVDGGRAS